LFSAKKNQFFLGNKKFSATFFKDMNFLGIFLRLKITQFDGVPASLGV
jgi:hypothetical protein